ncbi:SDR family NAD(P)-dependent oxidoreductase [Alkalihalobacillus sp. BA299]|uniref:SDR family NAD(P)-dependent oxidoreductase n=1 Tax=Alkalihalobacillus sp. BA299 TaxID=2815938 RepID=UPI001ADD33AF|nr:SDR family oxidoreductase [Alkalihalobacillus sp. BA299]
MSQLQNKVIMITGASTGLGRETAIQAAQAGANVAICCRHLNRIQEVEQLLSDYAPQVLAVQADVSIEDDVHRFVQETIARFGKIDVLINNAAVFENYTIADSSLESWQNHFDNNVRSAFLMSRECIPFMRKQKKGRIISLTTGLARQGASGFGAYSASKAALETLTFTVEEEEYQNGISAIAFNPGVMKTGIQALGEDPKNIAPILLDAACQSELGHGKIVTADEWKLKL